MAKPITIQDFNLGVDWQDAGPWRSFHLDTHGETKEELLANATISEVDQDGGELHCYGTEDCCAEVYDAVLKYVEHSVGLAALKEAAHV